MKRIWVLLACLLVGGGVVWAQSQQQEESLGAIARKLRSKKAKAAPTKVYTNDDLARLTGRVNVLGPTAAATTSAEGAAAESGAAPAEGEGAAPAGTGAGAGVPAGEKPEEEKGEKHWKDKFAEVRKKIALAEKELDLLQREWQLSRTQYTQDPNEALRQQYLGQQAGGKLNELQQKIQEKQAEIARYNRELTQLEDELRRFGGNPAWARP